MSSELHRSICCPFQNHNRKIFLIPYKHKCSKIVSHYKTRTINFRDKINKYLHLNDFTMKGKNKVMSNKMYFTPT